MLFKLKKIVGCIEPWVKNRDTNRIVSWCIVTALISIYNLILFRYRAPGLPPEHPECFRIFTDHGQKLCVPPNDIMNPSHCDTSTVNTSTWYRGRKLLRATSPTPFTRLSPPH